MKNYKKVYVASKTWHSPKIRAVRDSIKKDPTNNLQITSRWIDMGKDNPIVLNDKPELWKICHDDVMDADLFVLYSEPGDEHRGALVELGTAFACNIPVYAIGDCKSTLPDKISDVAFTHYPLFHTCPTHILEEGLLYVNAHETAKEYY